MIRVLATLPPGEALDYDIAVVGGGAAGITLALELAPSGARVAVLEGGGEQSTAASQARYEGPLTYDTAFDYPDLDVWRLRFLGGTTNHWNGWCRPLEDAVFAPRPGRHEVGWPFDRAALDGAYARAHEWCELGRTEYDPEVIATASGGGLPFTATDVLRPVAFRLSPPTRFAQRYHDRLAGGVVDVLLGANCVGFEARGRRIVAANVIDDGGRARRVTAGRFVLAGGGIENVRQLLLLAPDVPALDASGLLGVGFMEHPHIDLGRMLCDAADVQPGGRLSATAHVDDGTIAITAATLHEAVLAEHGLTGMAFTMLSPDDASAGRPFGEAVPSMWSAAGGGSASFQLAVRTEQRFEPTSRITLSKERDDLGLPRAALDWRLHPRDLPDVEEGTRLIVRELMAQGYGPLSRHAAGAPVPKGTGGAHHMGGARMHERAADGVVNADGRCHALDNLYVAGSATFPTSCYANPTLTIVALAVRLAGHLVAT